jgi:hypothetical protein
MDLTLSDAPATDGGRGHDGRFTIGNRGRPQGARGRLAVLLEGIIEGQAEAITRQVVDLAAGGDMAALRLCLQRLVPSRRDPHVEFDLPEVETIEDAERASSAILAAVAQGDLTPGEGEAMMRLLVAHRSIVESGDIERRLAALEARSAP